LWLLTFAEVITCIGKVIFTQVRSRRLAVAYLRKSRINAQAGMSAPGKVLPMTLSFQRGPRTLGVALAMAVLLASCGGGASGTPTGALSGATSTPRALDAAGQARVSELVAEGVPRADAIFMALASITVTPGNGKSERIVETFPTGNKVDMTVALDPTRHAQPDTVEVSTSETDAALTFTLSYFVPFAGMPDDVRQWIGSLTPSGSALLAFTGSGIRGPRPLFADVDGTGVIVQGIYSKATKEEAVLALETLKEYGIETSPLAIEVGEAVVDSALITKEWTDLAGKFDELQKCAENPANPLTKKMYQEQPGEKDKILQAINFATADMTENIIVEYIGALNNAAASTGPKWLGWLIGPVTKWATENLNDVNKQLLADITHQITKCVPGFKITIQWTPAGATDIWSGSGGYITGTVALDPTGLFLEGAGTDHVHLFIPAHCIYDCPPCGPFIDQGPMTNPLRLKVQDKGDGSFELKGTDAPEFQSDSPTSYDTDGFSKIGTFPYGGGAGSSTLSWTSPCGRIVTTLEIQADPV
jgi:hypothetical protein